MEIRHPLAETLGCLRDGAGSLAPGRAHRQLVVTLHLLTFPLQMLC